MLRISKLADYALVITSFLASQKEKPVQASIIAGKLLIPKPTVAKLLLKLSKANIVEAVRGNNGGYFLKQNPSEINIQQIIVSIDGPIALTLCSLTENSCSRFESCKIKNPWQKINTVLQTTLANITLDMLINNRI